MEHTHHMRQAITLGSRHKGLTGPNPSIGCIIVKDGHVVGRGITAPGGRPHAEMEALKQAGTKAQGATAYVTLEPCAHESETPSCAKELVRSGLVKVITALSDPDERTSGKGHKILKDAGIEVIEGILRVEAAANISGFLSRVKKGQPYYQLKMGITNDGKIAQERGRKSSVTGELSRKYAMYLRAKSDAILIGINTALADDPLLTVRVNGLEHASPIRIILDENGDLPLGSKLTLTANETPVLLVVDEKKHKNITNKFVGSGVEVLGCRLDKNHIDLQALTSLLYQRQIGQVMIEGGAKIAASFAKNGLIDEIAIFSSPQTFGAKGLNALQDMDLKAFIKKYQISESFSLGEDTFTLYQKA